MLEFTKMHGLGNDFVVIDAIHQNVSLTPDQLKWVADRHFGVGCDQILLVEKPVRPESDFGYRIFNADGGEVSQCGNGARCFAKFVRDKGLTQKDTIRVDTHAGCLVLIVDQRNRIRVEMGIPAHRPEDIPLDAEAASSVYTVTVDNREFSFGAVSLGNPHAVIHVADIERAPVREMGPLIEKHSLFPERVNVGFMQIIDRQHIRLRVYERGSGETLACGSGACAAGVIGIDNGELVSPVTVDLPGGQLMIEWTGRSHPVYMTGPAETVYEGKIRL